MSDDFGIKTTTYDAVDGSPPLREINLLLSESMQTRGEHLDF